MTPIIYPQQSNIMPSVNDSLIGYHIDYCFEYNNDEGDGAYLGLLDGVVQKIINAKTRMVDTYSELEPKKPLWRSMETVFWWSQCMEYINNH